MILVTVKLGIVGIVALSVIDIREVDLCVIAIKAYIAALVRSTLGKPFERVKLYLVVNTEPANIVRVELCVNTVLLGSDDNLKLYLYMSLTLSPTKRFSLSVIL